MTHRSMNCNTYLLCFMNLYASKCALYIYCIQHILNFNTIYQSEIITNITFKLIIIKANKLFNLRLDDAKFTLPIHRLFTQHELIHV